MMALEMLARQTSWLISISKMDFPMIAAVLGTTSTDIWPATMLLRYCYSNVLYTAIEERLNVAGLNDEGFCYLSSATCGSVNNLTKSKNVKIWSFVTGE
jgi:hypothetical protein